MLAIKHLSSEICDGKQRKSRWLLAALAFAFSFATLDRANACACCSDPGQRAVNTVAIGSTEQAAINNMAFGDKAELYVGSAEYSDIKGVKDTTGTYKLSVTQADNRMTFKFVDSENSHEGALSFVLPKSMTHFEVDPRVFNFRGGDLRVLDPNLYKEWRLTALVSGSGIFAPSSGKGQQITLIYHGSGNSCTDASSFTHWTLVVHGPVAEYTLFGILQNGEQEEKRPIATEMNGFESLKVGQQSLEGLTSSLASDYMKNGEQLPAPVYKPLREAKIVEFEIRNGLADPLIEAMQVRAIVERQDLNASTPGNSQKLDLWTVQEAARRWKCKSEPDADWTTTPCSK